MSTVTPTSTTFTTVEAAMYLAAGSSGTRRTLDLTTKFGATLLVRIGRVIGTALTRSGYVAIRRTNNDGVVHPNSGRDCVSTIATAQNTTLSAGVTANGTDLTLPFTSGTGFAIGDYICMHSDDTAGSRIEFARIVGISTNTITVEEPIKVTHNSADRVNSMADVFSVSLPGGDIWEIRCINNSGQGLCFAVDAQVYASDTVA